MISIIVPIYNVKEYMKRCINSIINQTYKDIEIILVDDGSTDESGIIADEYARLDERISVIHKKNGGLSDARNVGMEIARGNYICFIDSDDYIENNMIEEMHVKIEEEHAEVAICGFHVDYENNTGDILKSYKNILDANVIDISKNVNELNINLNFLKVLGYAWNKMYSLKFLKQHNFIFEKGLSGIEDTEFNSRVFQKVENFVIVDKAFNHYIQRQRETLGNKKYDNLLELNIRLCTCHNRLLQSWKLDKNIIDEIHYLDYFNVGKIHIKQIILENTTNKEKKEKISKLLQEKDINEAFKIRKNKNLKERIYSFFVRQKVIKGLLIFYNKYKKLSN